MLSTNNLPIATVLVVIATLGSCSVATKDNLDNGLQVVVETPTVSQLPVSSQSSQEKEPCN